MCRRGSGTGRRSITGIAAGQAMAPGPRSWASCGLAVMKPKAATGRSAPIPPWCAPTSTPPAPGGCRPRTWPQGASANDKNPAAGQAGREALGRSRGGLSTKIHLVADRRCLTRILTPGQRGDCPQFIPLMDQLAVGRRGKGRPRTGRPRPWATRRTPPPPTAPTCANAASRRSSRSRKTRRTTASNRGSHGGLPAHLRPWTEQDRNTVERCFGKLKQFRAVATRYDKREFMYQGTVDLASIQIWLRDPVP